MRNDFIKHINIYKYLYRSAFTASMPNDKDICMYMLDLYNDDYNCIDTFNNMVMTCKNEGITDVTDIVTIVERHLRFKNRSFMQISDIIEKQSDEYLVPDIPNDYRFAKLDCNKTYLSIDLKHAFSQYIDSLNILGDTFDNLYINSLPYDILSKSKNIRTFIYHQFNIINYKIAQTYLIQSTLYDIDHELIKLINKHELLPVSYNIDEILFDITNYVDEFTKYIGLQTINNLETHVTVFNPHYITYIHPELNQEKRLDIRYYPNDNTNYIAQKTCKYVNQLYKAYKNLPLCDYDLYVPKDNNPNEFYMMSEPVKIISIE